MLQSLIHFSTLAAGLLQEEHPPAELANPFNFGLSPFGVVVIVLLAMVILWVAMNVQAGRADLHSAASHGNGHLDGDHHDGDHHDGDHHGDGH
jgi:hypothetical protein